MLKKLLEKIPYNPSIINQISFYSKRMRQESILRRTSLIFIVLAFFVQFFAFISPPQSTVAASPNDLINGGFSSASQAADFCNANNSNYGTILANYNITCSEIANAPTVTLNSNDYNKQLFSMGRLPYGLKGETPVVIAGTTYYFRYLWAWDTAGSSNYQALKINSSDGKTYFVLYACGNLVSIGLPTAPNLTISKTTSPGFPVANSNVTPGETLSYRVIFGNSGGAAQNVVISDPLPNYTTYSWFGTGGANVVPSDLTTNQAKWIYSTLPAGANNDYVDMRVTVNDNVPNGTQICNIASISSNETSPLSSNQVCMTVVIPSTPVVVVTHTPPPVVIVTHTPAPTCQYDSSLAASSVDCRPCQASINSQDSIACIKVHKTAANLTEGISNADGTTAQAGDEIVYTLYADNTGLATVNNYVFTENLSDVLDYSNIENLYGGTIGSNNQLTWPAVNIPAGQTSFEKVAVKIMNPIPQTPTSSSDPGYYNLEMVNVYGNAVTIHLPPTIVKTVEAVTTTTATLTNTGPGTDIFISAMLIAVIGYFFARSRLLAKEASISINNNLL